MQRKLENDVDLKTVLLTQFRSKKQVHTCVVHVIIPAQIHSSQRRYRVGQWIYKISTS